MHLMGLGTYHIERKDLVLLLSVFLFTSPLAFCLLLVIHLRDRVGSQQLKS